MSLANITFKYGNILVWINPESNEKGGNKITFSKYIQCIYQWDL